MISFNLILIVLFCNFNHILEFLPCIISYKKISTMLTQIFIKHIFYETAVKESFLLEALL